MARVEARLPENADGEFYVDDTCIDCETCRFVAPATFGLSDRRAQSFVHHQPAAEDDTHRAAMALVACPTGSIGTLHEVDIGKAVTSFPEVIDGDLLYCGFAAESSFGAQSYLIRRPTGNVLVDSPRAAGPLLARLEALGGVATMVLTHRDDVADHAAFRRRFGCERILHRDDVTAGTKDVERKVKGKDPVRLADDLLLIPVPGHTRGSMALLYRDEALFSGDHLWWSAGDEALEASRSVCWYSWPDQVRSLERLLQHRFHWLLPGHGRRHRADSAEAMREEIAALLGRLGR